MPKFKVEINETLSRIIEVEAENENDAVSKIKDLYRKEEIVLDVMTTLIQKSKFTKNKAGIK